MSEPSPPPSHPSELSPGDLLLGRLLAANRRENAELRRRLTQSGEFEIPRPAAARND